MKVDEFYMEDEMEKIQYKIAVWEPTDELLHNVKKFNDKEFKIISYFSDEYSRKEIDKIPVKKKDEITNTEFDYLVIPYEHFQDTKQELLSKYGIQENVYTFQEFWVKDCEKMIVHKYHDLWKRMKAADIQIFKEKTVLITGGNSGIGKECAFAFAYAGANVIIAGRDEQKLQNVCENTRKVGKCKYIKWDVRNVSDYESKIREAEEKFRTEIDILVNSAGIFDGAIKDFFEITATEFDHVLETNLKGTYFMCQVFAKYFINKRKKGHIVNVVSNLGTLPTVKPYGISKWGMVGLTKGLGLHLAEYGITVNGVAPGEVATPINGWKEGDCPARRAHKNGRLSFPCEVAQVILYLAGFTGENMIGEIVVCDGGDKTINTRL